MSDHIGVAGIRQRQNLALAITSLIVTLLLLELGVRGFAWSTGHGFWESPYDFVSPFFTTDGWPSPVRDGDSYVFKEGERVARAKPAGEIRVVCLGGSTTLPSRDADGLSYPRELERLLRLRFPDRSIVVLNAGENGYSSAHTLVNLALRVLDAAPDIVTVYEDVNDLSVNYFGDGAETDYGNKYLSEYYLSYRHRTGLLAELGRISRFVRIVDNRLELFRWAGRDYDDRRDWRPGLRYFTRNLRSLVGLARIHGVSIVLGTQAARASRRTEAGFAAYNAAIRQVATELAVPLADVVAAVVDEGPFLDDVHQTSAGNRTVAQQLLEPVARAIATGDAAAERP